MPGRAGQLRIADEPARRMTGHVQLGHDTDPAVTGEHHDLPDLCLRVEHAIGPGLMQLREDLALHAEALIIAEMPVQHVELDRGHRVEVALDDLGGDPVPLSVDEQTAPREARPIGDARLRDAEAAAAKTDQLQEGLDATQRPMRAR